MKTRTEASPEKQGAVRRTNGQDPEMPTDKDMEIAAELLVAAAREGRIYR